MEYKYYAFISYRGADVKWAKWFVRKSDNYAQKRWVQNIGAKLKNKTNP